MTITYHSLELKWRFFYLFVSYGLTLGCMSIYFQELLGWVFWPFCSIYPRIQWQYHYGLEAFYVFWYIILGTALLWLIPWIFIQGCLYLNPGQWEKDSYAYTSVWKFLSISLIGYSLYYWGYSWIVLNTSHGDWGILIQPTVMDFVGWFYRCLLLPYILYGSFLLFRFYSLWRSLVPYRHYYWLGSFFLGSWITPPDGMTQIFLLIPVFILFEWQIWKGLFRDVTKR